MRTISPLQERAAELFANMTVNELTTNNPWVTTKAYSEVGECQNNGDSFTDIKFAWEEAMEQAIVKADSEGCGWMVFKKHQYSDVYHTTYVQANDQVAIEALKNEDWEMAAYYKNFAAWSEAHARDTMKSQVILSHFYIHNCLEHYTSIIGNMSFELDQLAQQSYDYLVF